MSLGSEKVRVWKVTHSGISEQEDQLAIEEPLTIQLTFGPVQQRQRRVHSITMRTPGQDQALAVGLLVSDRVLNHPSKVLTIQSGLTENLVRVELHPDVEYDPEKHSRAGYTTSSCGLCGKTSIEALLATLDCSVSVKQLVHADVISSLPTKLQAAQKTFALTGGLHAAALFDLSGALTRICEDVGRHNAVDKLVGEEFLRGKCPLHDQLLFVSARASYELIQKAAVAGVAIFAAVGAPSSLAVQLANELGMTLLGFVREDRFNIYSAPERIAFSPSASRL